MSVAATPPTLATRVVPRPMVSKAAVASGSSSKVAIPRARAPMSSLKSSTSASSGKSSSSTSPAANPNPLVQLAGKDTSSSSGTVFAKPTKEWVLPERAKPGRKVAADEPDNKRQSQNRLSQRAHRARRTDYIATLEERIRQFEADEIHSNVRLQEVARALKADNERLKAEVVTLREQAGPAAGWEKIQRDMQEEINSLREQVNLLRSSASSIAVPAGRQPPSRSTVNPRLLTPEIESRGRKTLECPICPDPDPDCPCQQSQNQNQLHQSTTVMEDSRTFDLSPSIQLHQKHDHHPDHGCGFCRGTEMCLCTMIDEKPNIDTTTTSLPMKSTSPIISHSTDDGCGLCTSSTFCACKAALELSPQLALQPTIPAAVPLKLRNRSTNKPPIWRLDPPVSTSAISAQKDSTSSASLRSEPVCTGDPSNCDACKNDTFGQEFCQHLFASPLHPCTTCNGVCTSTTSESSSKVGPTTVAEEEQYKAPLIMACCGEPGLCGHGGGCNGEVIGIGGGEALESKSGEQGEHTTMRPEQAWKALKAHPNAKFTSLALLADVVARRNTCTGGSESPLPPNAPAPASPSTKAVHEALHVAGVKGKRKIEVDSGAVRDALRILDEQGKQDSQVERGTKRRRV